ncbi:M16 family metallopeptidase [Pelagicoccus mobilis]|uniref:Insulinase family protein n=1 Tax=Pelagicoccus mobilis TaxID=415221 RepID=A0A934VK89_9BACT|nr:M16 family metallopeptidase [Pelagicoccus mobilis]MBK1876411.1 insulinase family protein [Pelagicoccus mobilis]
MLRRLFVFALVSLTVAVAVAKRVPWPHENSELEPDPDIVWGVLDNGFRYALLPHDAKEGLVSMRLLVGVGSLDEEEDERGLSHFIEHMAFEGTRNFKPGELIEFFQQLGMSYGVDVNAFTYHDKTVYHLELPQNDEELIGQGLRLYRDYADGILFAPERVENERDVILREKQARSTPSAKITQASFRFSFAGTKLAERNPIGLEWVVEETSVEQLKAFYEKWYRPELMTLVVVGDFDQAMFERKIEENFASLKAPKGRIPNRKIGRLARTKPFRTGHLYVEGVERFTLEISRSWMDSRKTDGWSRRELDARRSFATSLFNERCRVLIDGMSDNFANYNRVFGIPYCQLSISSGGDFWWDAFVWLDQLLRQALMYGFTKEEVDYLKHTWLQSSRSAALRYESAEPRMLIDELVDSISQNRVYLSSEEVTGRMDRYIESLSLQEINKAFAEVWNLKRLSYFMAGEIDSPLSEKALKRRFQDERSYAVLPYIPRLPEKFEYTDLGEAGVVVETEELKIDGAKSYRFSNNARLTFLRTENEKDTVRSLVRIGGGMLAFSDSNPGTHALAMSSLFRSGFGGYDIDDVYKELRSNVNSFVFGVDDHDAFTYRALTQPDGLDEFFKIVAEYLLDPTVDDEAFDLARSKLKQSRELEPDGMNEGYRDLHRMLYPEQPRFHAPSLRDLVDADRVAVQEWVEEPFREGYLEVAVVGDIEEQALLELFAETFGALPSRRESKADFEEVRALKLDSNSGKRTIEYAKGMGDNAASVIVWTIQDDISVRESAALYILSNVLETRIREQVREGMGASYSPSVRYVTFPAYETLRHIRADVDCMKGDADALLDVVLKLSEELAAEILDGDELLTAVAPLEEGLRQAWSDNSYLLENVLYGVHEYPKIIDNAILYRDGLLSSITPEEVQAIARRYLSSEAALAVSIVPSEHSEIAENPDWEEQSKVGRVE